MDSRAGKERDKEAEGLNVEPANGRAGLVE
jgi:hypothetical protein